MVLVIETEVLSSKSFGLKRIESSSKETFTVSWTFRESSHFAPEIDRTSSAIDAFAPSERSNFLFIFLAILKYRTD